MLKGIFGEVPSGHRSFTIPVIIMIPLHHGNISSIVILVPPGSVFNHQDGQTIQGVQGQIILDNQLNMPVLIISVSFISDRIFDQVFSYLIKKAISSHIWNWSSHDNIGLDKDPCIVCHISFFISKLSQLLHTVASLVVNVELPSCFTVPVFTKHP